MSKPQLSPLATVEDIAYQKLKDVPFTVRHYLLALALLTVVPVIVTAFFQSDIVEIALLATVGIAWIVSRIAGRIVSRKDNFDSVLAYRYFAATPWVIATVSTGISLLIGRLDEATHVLYVGIFWVALVITLLHILGIFIHYKKSQKMVRNIKKEDLFQ